MNEKKIYTYLKKAKELYEAKKYDQCLSELNALLSLDPHNSPALLLKEKVQTKQQEEKVFGEEDDILFDISDDALSFEDLAIDDDIALDKTVKMEDDDSMEGLFTEDDGDEENLFSDVFSDDEKEASEADDLFGFDESDENEADQDFALDDILTEYDGSDDDELAATQAISDFDFAQEEGEELKQDFKSEGLDLEIDSTQIEEQDTFEPSDDDFESEEDDDMSAFSEEQINATVKLDMEDADFPDDFFDAVESESETSDEDEFDVDGSDDDILATAIEDYSMGGEEKSAARKPPEIGDEDDIDSLLDDAFGSGFDDTVIEEADEDEKSANETHQISADEIESMDDEEYIEGTLILDRDAFTEETGESVNEEGSDDAFLDDEYLEATLIAEGAEFEESSNQTDDLFKDEDADDAELEADDASVLDASLFEESDELNDDEFGGFDFNDAQDEDLLDADDDLLESDEDVFSEAKLQEELSGDDDFGENDAFDEVNRSGGGDTFEETLLKDFDEEIFDFDKVETGSIEEESLGPDVEKIRKLWTDGAECFRNKDYQECISKMEELLSIDPQNDSAKGYIEMAQEKLTLESHVPSEKEEAAPEKSVDTYEELMAAGDSLSRDSEGEDFFAGLGLDDDDVSSTSSKASYEDDMLDGTLIKDMDKSDLSFEREEPERATEDLSSIEKLEELAREEAQLEQDIDDADYDDGGLFKRAYAIGIIGVILAVVILGAYSYRVLFQSKPKQQTASGQNTDEPEPTKKVIEAAVVEDEKIAQQYFEQGIEFFQLKRYSEAAEQFNLYLNIKPQDKKALKYLADIKQAQDELKNDLEKRQKLQTIQKLYAEGEKLFKNEDYPGCIKKMQMVLKLAPDNSGAQYSIARAKEELQKIRAEKEKQDKITKLLRQAQLNLDNERYEDALKLFDEVQKLDPENKQAIVGIENAQTGLANYRLKTLNNLLKTGQEHFQYKRYYSCIETMKKALNLDPNNPTAKNYLDLAKFNLKMDQHRKKGKEYFNKGYYQECINEMDQLLSKLPEDPEAQKYKSWAEAALDLGN